MFAQTSAEISPPKSKVLATSLRGWWGVGGGEEAEVYLLSLATL